MTRLSIDDTANWVVTLGETGHSHAGGCNCNEKEFVRAEGPLSQVTTTV